MPDESSDKIWDEYDWERFLQEQELRTEKYMELLEKYMDHPQRDEIIAREMGWTHLLDGESRDWEEEVDAEFEQELAEGEEAPDEAGTYAFQRHPLYQQMAAFCAELDELSAAVAVRTKEPPALAVLQTQTTLASAKLAAALHDDQIDELGMSIAYLKRALFAINLALEAAMQLELSSALQTEEVARLRARVFEVRDGIVSTMGDYRAKFRRRHGR